MKDQRGAEVEVGNTVMFSQKTGDFGKHKITEGTVVKICPRTATIGYTEYYGNNYTEGNYRSDAITVVTLPQITENN